MSDRILIVEDEEVLRENLCEFLNDSGFVAEGAADGIAGLERALEAEYSVVLTDIRMPGLDGIGLLKKLVAARPQTPILIMTAFASVESAIEALRFGAYDYLLKPVVFEELLQKVRNLIEVTALKGEITRLRQSFQQRLGFAGIIGESPAIENVFSLIDKVAPAQTTVLITGESGTGKELVARAIHEKSAAREREFLAVNVAAMPKDLVESQLFGHERGAFTNAVGERQGILRAARGGTVFLDEVGELSAEVQVKLLRAIESHEVVPVGADRATTAAFRLLAATNQPLEDRVADGTFRRDLFYRLNVFRIVVPPLRERREDIPALTRHFVNLHSHAVGKRVEGVDNDGMRMLSGYDWPGNVRELSNVIERGALLTDGAWISPTELPAEIGVAVEAPVELKPALDAYEREHIRMTLARVHGDKACAAELLGIHLATLYRRMEKLGVE